MALYKFRISYYYVRLKRLARQLGLFAKRLLIQRFQIFVRSGKVAEHRVRCHPMYSRTNYTKISHSPQINKKEN